MKCKDCGYENVENARFCCHCGKELEEMKKRLEAKAEENNEEQ